MAREDLCDLIIEYHEATADFVRLVHKYTHDGKHVGMDYLNKTIEQVIQLAREQSTSIGQEASEEIIDAGLRAVGALAKWKSAGAGRAW